MSVFTAHGSWSMDDPVAAQVFTAVVHLRPRQDAVAVHGSVDEMYCVLCRGAIPMSYASGPPRKLLNAHANYCVRLSDVLVGSVPLEWALAHATGVSS